MRYKVSLSILICAVSLNACGSVNTISPDKIATGVAEAKAIASTLTADANVITSPPATDTTFPIFSITPEVLITSTPFSSQADGQVIGKILLDSESRIVGISKISWTFNGSLLFSNDKLGFENYKIYLCNAVTSTSRLNCLLSETMAISDASGAFNISSIKTGQYYLFAIRYGPQFVGTFSGTNSSGVTVLEPAQSKGKILSMQSCVFDIMTTPRNECGILKNPDDAVVILDIIPDQFIDLGEIVVSWISR